MTKATITSETENEVVAEKAKGNGWLGGLAQTRNQNTTANLNTCGGPMNRTSQATAFADWRALSNLDTMPIYTRGANYTANTRLMNLIPYLQGATNINITSITKANPAVVTTASNHGLADDDIILAESILAGINFLDSHLEYSAVHGKAFLMSLESAKSEPFGKLIYFSRYPFK